MAVAGTGSQKIRELRNEFDDKSGAFIDALFRRAPKDFLQRTPVRALGEITRGALSLFEEFKKSSAPSLVRVVNHSGTFSPYTSIYTCISDRPFVVDSLAELYHSQGFRQHVLLHPIFRADDGRLFSITYGEIDRIDDEAAMQKLASLSEKVLWHTQLVTEDFKSVLARVDEAARALSREETNGKESTVKEVGDFLRWLAEGGFVFLGSREWLHEGAQLRVADGDLGLFKTNDPVLVEQLAQTTQDASSLLKTGHILQFSKILADSPVHRRQRMDFITVLIPPGRNYPARVFGFLGMLSSRALSQEATSVPILRKKLTSILDIEGLLPNSHDYKEVVALVNSMPKSDLFQFDVDTLRSDLHLIMGMQRRGNTRMSVRTHSHHRFVAATVFLPKERFSGAAAEEMKYYFEQRFNGGTAPATYHAVFVEDAVVALYFLVPNPTLAAPESDLAEMERAISDLSLTWEDRLFAILVQKKGKATAGRIVSMYADLFPDQYKASATPEQAACDIELLGSLTEDNSLAIDLRQGSDGELDVLLYKLGATVTLSSVIPFLENTGFEVSSEMVAPLTSNGRLWASIHTYRVTARRKGVSSSMEARVLLQETLQYLLRGEAENDALNALAVTAGLTVREIAVIRCLANYLWQIKAAPSETAITTALIENPECARIIVEAFAWRFDTNKKLSLEDRAAKFLDLKQQIDDKLKTVTLLAHDRILRALFNVVDSAVRTNFYRDRKQLRVAIKIDCKRIAKMPEPRPLFEIFVSGPELEGVHLRGGRVARGGLRWSERPEDFRTEVLGLMKTQMVKNSIIVPVGAKGGFIVKGRADGKAPTRAQVESCYRQFIRCLLEVTDNIEQDTVVHPPDCVVWDAPDTYFVVAADKGTAQFSDIANEIAVKEFNFWLGDAFASGGSQGYNHKKYGITARGAWETAKRHFREIGIDPDKQVFTAVGIGDMSGDVFGNGMLLSKKLKLIAAFDHRHIFVDPNPDAEASYAERKRLFDLPSSSWADYASDAISKGGAIYPRDAKEITLSAEIRKALDVEQSQLSGHELVRAILKAPVDLLWNGGIGTYVKSTSEHNITVADRANDEVRVDARDLRAKIVSEGGNLGFTQLGRIEFAQHGGRVNTDAVDNSGGVNLSDLEVNFKILLRKPMESGELRLEARNRVLFDYAEEACEMVCARNRAQSLTISTSTFRSKHGLGFCKSLIDHYERAGYLDRKGEYLPDEETFHRREQKRLGLYRPEMAVLVAYTKMWIFDTVIESPIADSPELEEFLLSYFPKDIAGKFSTFVIAHPLRREIIASQIANAVVDRMGATFLHRTGEESGASDIKVIQAYLAALRILDGDTLTEELQVADTAQSSRVYLLSLDRLAAALDGMTRWLLARCTKETSIGNCIKRYQYGFQELFANTHLYVPPPALPKFEDAIQEFVAGGISKPLARKIAGAAYASAYLDIIDIATALQRPIEEVAALYSKLVAELGTSKLTDVAKKIEPVDHWDTSAIRSLIADVQNAVSSIVRAVIEDKKASSLKALNEYLADREEIVDRYRASLRELETRLPTVSSLLVISNQLLALASRAT